MIVCDLRLPETQIWVSKRLQEWTSITCSKLQHRQWAIALEVSALVWDCFQTNLYRIYGDFSSVSLCVFQFLGVLNTSPGLGDSAKPSCVHTQPWSVPTSHICVVFHWLWYWSCREKLLFRACIYLQWCFQVEVHQNFLPCAALMVFLSVWPERKWGRRNMSLACPASPVEAPWKCSSFILSSVWIWDL